METRTLPGADVTVTSLCIGTSPLGSPAPLYGREAPESEALETVAAALASPIRFMDTSNNYGTAETRIGRVLQAVGAAPDFVLATKADPSGDDFSGERVRRSFEESRERLGMSRFQIFHLHDPDPFEFTQMTGPGGAVSELIRLKEEGLVDLLGIATGSIDLIHRYLDLGVFDVVLNHNCYTLLERGADELISRCDEAGLAFFNAAPFASGALARPHDPSAKYQYGTADSNALDRIARLDALCRRYGVDLAAVALRFSTRDPRITSTIVGVSRPERVRQLIELHEADIPDEIWAEADALGRD